MRVLLATTADKLAEKLNVLNPELEYCGIVTNDVESAKEILTQVGLSAVPLYPMSELKTCVEELSCDYVLCENIYRMKILHEIERKALSRNKTLIFDALSTTENFKTEQALRYYKEHSQDFEMFATGISYAFSGIDVTKFYRKLFNLAKGSQDLYYDFLIAKNLISYGGGHSNLRYALIGLAPYSFHYDLSCIFLWSSRLLSYLIIFNDVHNFPLSANVYKSFFREEWLTQKVSLKSFNEKSPYGIRSNKIMDLEEYIKFDLDTMKGILWKGKYYPKTRDENIKILDDYLTLCEENNIRPVMFRVPVTEKYMANFNPQLLEEFDVLVEQALSKHSNAQFFDGWKLPHFTYDYFYDYEHLNTRGATKFSAYLNDFIEQLER